MTNIESIINDFNTFNKTLMEFLDNTSIEEIREYNQKVIQEATTLANPISNSGNYYEATEYNLLRQTKDLNGTYITPVIYLNRSNEANISMDKTYLFNMGKVATFKNAGIK